MKVSFDRMSLDQIDTLIKEAHKAKVQKQDIERNRLREVFAQQAAERGFTLADLLGSGAGSGANTRGYKATQVGSRTASHTKRSGKFTYRNPSNPSETWAGWGRRPVWLNTQLKAGKALDQFRA